MITRFAPSPTGPLHLGHAYSAIIAHDIARAAGGQFLLRFEDTDRDRSRIEWENLIIEDLSWLGLSWDAPPRRQSDHLADYDAALARLAEQGLVFPCNCNRADIRAAASAPQEGVPTHGPDGVIYPGTCRARAFKSCQPNDALRLNMRAAVDALSKPLPTWKECGTFAKTRQILTPELLITGVGDVVLSRRNMGTVAYHLAVAVDDALQGITLVTRGADLQEATQIHVLLQTLLGLSVPDFLHHDLIRDEQGKRLAKRDDARSIKNYRKAGLSPGDLRALLPTLATPRV